MLAKVTVTSGDFLLLCFGALLVVVASMIISIIFWWIVQDVIKILEEKDD